MRKILVIGAGGREHAIAWRLKTEGAEVYAAPGNIGMFSDGILNAGIDAQNFDEVVEFTKFENVDLVIIGPEKPLVDGLADRLRDENIGVIGPGREAARLESSKVYAKEIMVACGIPTAKYESFSDFQSAVDYIKSAPSNIVIKADGLAGGKGVVTPESEEEAINCLRFFMEDGAFGEASKVVLIEERLEGPELSFMCLTDGEFIIALPTSRDHKRLLNSDRGPNTGGMGAITPSPDETKTTRSWVCEHVLRPLFDRLKRDGISYQGFLYVGLILTDEGPKVLEFNVRLGDPETQALLFSLTDSFSEHLFNIVNKTLKRDYFLSSEKAACVVLASKNYSQGSVEKGKIISGIGTQKSKIFYAGVEQNEGVWLTAGGRVLTLCSKGEDAIDVCLRDAKKIKWDGVQYRDDIKP